MGEDGAEQMKTRTHHFQMVGKAKSQTTTVLFFFVRTMLANSGEVECSSKFMHHCIVAYTRSSPRPRPRRRRRD